jgi:prepilin-type processing-associated H-X9-DG protein
MKKLAVLARSAVLVALFADLALAQSGAQPTQTKGALTGTEIKDLITGATLSYKYGTTSWEMKFMSDGKAESKGYGNTGMVSGPGNWQITGDQFCVTWQVAEWRASCRAIERDGRGNYLFIDGRGRTFFTVDR